MRRHFEPHVTVVSACSWVEGKERRGVCVKGEERKGVCVKGEERKGVERQGCYKKRLITAAMSRQTKTWMLKCVAPHAI